MAELVDALDLGSSGLKLWGFESPLSHHNTDGIVKSPKLPILVIPAKHVP